MRLLLDTHALLWALADPGKLSAAARAAITDADNEVLVSAATTWEIAIKRALGRLEAPAELEEAIDRTGFQALPITVAHTLVAGALPPLHTDPFDRILVAQAQLEGLTLVTRDTRMAAYAVEVLAA
ncbi:MAG: type II toxin-antitoxin system VapC family toxin [Candidatus Dormibacteria bacterium]